MQQQSDMADRAAPAAPVQSAPWFVYILRCADDTLYTGITTDVERRLAAHNAGRGAKYTRCRRPVAAIYTEQCAGHAEALRRERFIKRLSRREKEWLARL